MKSTIQPTKEINVGPKERIVSVIGGTGLLVYTMFRPSRATAILGVLGGLLLVRGASGKSVTYQLLNISRASQTGGIDVERAVTIFRPREEVYAFWRDFENLPRFMEHLEAVTTDGERGASRLTHWVAKAPLNMKAQWDAEIVEERPNELIAWRSLSGSVVQNKGRVTFKDAPGGRGTEVHVHLQYDLPGGSASAAIAKLFGEEPGLQVREDLRRFKQMLETGETATVTGQPSGRVKQTQKERDEIQLGRVKDVVQEASEDSFPASDAPGWASGNKGITSPRPE